MQNKELIKNIYRSLPQEIGDVIASFDTLSIVDGIAKKNQLNIEQKNNLGDELTLKLIGLTPSNSFQSSLEVRLAVTPEIASAIVKEISEKILSQVPIKIQLAQEEYTQVRLKKPDEAVVITMENKAEALESLARRTINNELVPPKVPEIPPSNLLMVEKGEVAHSVPYVEPTINPPSPKATAEPVVITYPESINPPAPPAPPKVPLPDYRYPAGKDPYKEPLV